jgi:hypothetical protein
MKKLLSVLCFVLYLQGIAQPPIDARLSALKSPGKKELIKALLAIVDREGQKKSPVKRAQLPANSKA